MRALQELRFNWRDKLPPYSYATSLSMGLQHYPDEHLLLGIYQVPLVRVLQPYTVCFVCDCRVSGACSTTLTSTCCWG